MREWHDQWKNSTTIKFKLAKLMAVPNQNCSELEVCLNQLSHVIPIYNLEGRLGTAHKNKTT